MGKISLRQSKVLVISLCMLLLEVVVVSLLAAFSLAVSCHWIIATVYEGMRSVSADSIEQIRI